MPSVDEPGPLGPPPPTTQYPNLEAIKTALQAHAAENRYATKVDSSTSKRASIICSKGGKYDSKGKSDTVAVLAISRRLLATVIVVWRIFSVGIDPSWGN